MQLFIITIAILVGLCRVAAVGEKINLDTLNNYSEFFNFGEKKLAKLASRNALENAIIKSKIDVLGEVFKSHIDSLKAWQKLDLIFLIDASSSVGERNFKSEMKFVKKLLSDVIVDFNHTRVAVITFSSAGQVIRNIDEVSKPKKENNKCLLLNKQLNGIKYTGGGTYTMGAFEEAQEIFKGARNDSKKVLFLITDGFSNGGDPVPLAGALKEKSVTIFTIGIQNGNYRELYELSSSPGQYYSYLLSSFQEFESLARRALHVDLQTGDYIPLGISTPCDSLCNGGNCCDDNAVCTCGTTTGHYSCICQPGYYGSGLRNSCLPCPFGSYSDGLNLCLPCPDMHHTTTPPAISIDSCTCKTGYQTGGGGQCEIVKCPKMSTPQYGYFVKKRDCDNVFNSACGVRCEVGYILVGTSIRLCQVDGTWSGEPTSCQIKTCPRLPPPLNGTIKCLHADLGISYDDDGDEDLPVDAVCNFDCPQGRTLIGSSQRTCLPLAMWDGLKTSCKHIKCPKLPPIKNGNIEPKSCLFGKQSFGKKCKISCNEGFILEGPKQKTCTGRHGLWDTKFESTICKDVTPPAMICPENITSTTVAGRKFGTVSWAHPNVTDNSDLEVSVWMKPIIKNITGFKFKIGTTKVIYFAQDAFHNRNNCSFYITVEDREPPLIEDCESPPTFLTTDTLGTNVTWDEPNIVDNSQSVQVRKSHDVGYFPFGTTTVTYTASDKSGNENVCVLNITVEEVHCEALPDPIYGRSECSRQAVGMQCVISCQEGYAVPLAQPQTFENSSIVFLCDNSESIWYNQEGLMFPECSVTTVPKEILQSGLVKIETDLNNCNDTALDDLTNDVKVVLQEQSCKGNCTINTTATCEDGDDVEEEDSNVIKRDTTFQEVPHKNKSKRRHRKKKVNVKFQVKGKYADQAKPTSIRGKNVTITYEHPVFICPVGFIPRKNRCVQCPKGTFHNATTNKCQSCHLGYYNDKLGQTECKSCPLHHSTRKLHSKKLRDCKEQCPPGTIARRKFIKSSKRRPNEMIERATLKPYCKSCPVGYYQPDYGQFKCYPCLKGYTTTSTGSSSLSLCIPAVDEICHSNPNVCNNGQCVIENEFGFSCNCTDDYFGDYCEKKFNPCDSNPCQNGARCDNTHAGFVCNCLDGSSGKFCEFFDEDCSLNCSNHGVCAQIDDKVYCICPNGFTGRFCEVKMNFCHEWTCENNSTCLEVVGGFRCDCSKGFIGRRCNILPCDYKPCRNTNKICVNRFEENATKDSYSCSCPEGFQGEFCDKKVDLCTENPCLNDGICTTSGYSFVCACSKLFYGQTCEFRRDCNYTLNFPKFSTTDYIKLSGFKDNISEITACLWLQTEDNFNYGTLLSYATRNFDNAFTLTDYTGLVLYINNQHVVTDVLLNDGFWHHVCVTWEGSNGSYNLYLDGRIVRNGSSLAAQTEINGGGNMVIGQEQDTLGGRFSQSESFIGKMAYIDVWSKVLSMDEITKHLGDCQDSFFGDIYGWPEIRDNVQGNIAIENSSFCTKCPEPKPIFNGIINIVDNVAYYGCSKGFKLHNGAYSEGRKCTKASKWEGFQEPYCKRVYCGYPGYVRNSYIIGNKYFYNDRISYVCFEGYNLTGNSTLICSENATWHPDKPHCAGPQCTAFKTPQNANLTIIAEHSFEEFSENQSTFDVGTQVEIICAENANLTGESVITCQENGTWDHEPPECVRNVIPTEPKSKLDCAINLIPPPPLNGYIVVESLNEVENGTSNFLEYKCRNGHKLVGDNTTTCIIDGYWSQPNITCDPILCRQPKFKNMVIKSEVNNEYHHYGNMIKFECVEGYRIFGDSTIRCSDNGKWTKMRARCLKKSCREPVVSELTTIEGDSYFYQDKVVITCPNNEQYTLTCNKYGMWIGEKDESC